ncbi:MAG: hypothetical protein WA851_02800 [Xanthobacteraceae bacterium]
MRATSRPDHRTLAEVLRLRVLDGPGKTDQATRQAAAERAAGGPTIEAPYDDLARQIGESATGVTDEQVMSVVQAIGSEKAAFEVIAAATLGAGLLRWQRGLKVLDEVVDASA